MEAAVLTLTILLSTMAAGFATYYLNVSKERLHRRGNKAEELYCAVEVLDQELSNFFEKHYSLFGDLRRTSGPHELEKAGAYLATTKMLVGFYFPSLSSVLARAIAAVATAHSSLRALEEAAEADRSPLIPILDTAVVELKDALEALKSAVIKDGRITSIENPFALIWRSAKPAGVRRVLEVPT